MPSKGARCRASLRLSHAPSAEMIKAAPTVGGKARHPGKGLSLFKCDHCRDDDEQAKQRANIAVR
jgi:hypothetical protein